MIIEKTKNEQGLYDITFIKDKKIFKIIFGGNLDLYWYFHDNESNERSGTFEITKENYQIYNMFDELYNNIKEVKIYDLEEIDFMFCTTINDIKEKYNEKERMNNEIKNRHSYKEIFKDGIITWKCDDYTHEEKTNLVNIHKKDEKYIIEFIFNNKDYYSKAIRFRNSGSYYNPFNLLFMKMFNKLQEYDPNDKQIHIEEYLYKEKKLTRKRESHE